MIRRRFTKHPVHYYEDGDILLKTGITTFLVHKSFLSLSSEFFKNLFKLSKPSTNENVKFVENQPHPIIEINDETSESVERMLSFIYPNSYIKITLDNVEDLLRLADKFIISKITNYCGDFLFQNFQQDVFFTFRMADKYLLAEAFRETSKLILDDLEKYRCDPDYDQLSDEARLKLMDSWFNYVSLFNKLIKDNKDIKIGIGKSSIKTYLVGKSTTTILKPSELIKLIKTDSCLKSLREGDTLNTLTKNFEPLKYKPSDENILYIFAELD